MGLLSLTYRRPPQVERPQSPSGDSLSDDVEKSSLRSGQSGASVGIPDALTFDKIMNGGTCPPCTIRDFMNYLIYIEHAAENLQFFLWYRDYEKRFKQANTSDLALAPEWTQAMHEDAVAKIHKEAADKRRREPEAAAIFKGTDFEKTAADLVIESKDPFSTPPQSSGGPNNPSIYSGSQASGSPRQIQDAFTAAGVKQPFTIQPFREEITRVISTYIVEDAPRQLNLSARTHKLVMMALAYTTHPSAFRGVVREIEHSLRRQAHPNFIRWTICNGNPARVCFAKILGIATLVLATIAAILITLSSANRGYRAIPAVGWVLGIATLITAYKGMCVVMHGMHHRHVRPWELFEDSGASEEAYEINKPSFDSFGTANSYEDEPWIVKYDHRNLVRKVFDREVWIQEPALRSIQDTIFVQSMLAALVGAAVLTAIFVAVPGGRYY